MIYLFLHSISHNLAMLWTVTGVSDNFLIRLGPTPLNILEMGGVRVPILFGNDFLLNDLAFSKRLMMFRCLVPSIIMLDF